MNHRSTSRYDSRYHDTIELIGRRWTGVILKAMLGGAIQFSELTSAIPGLSDRLASVRLKELEAAGIVERVIVPNRPVRIEYHLTDKGRSLRTVVNEIERWARTWQ